MRYNICTQGIHQNVKKIEKCFVYRNALVKLNAPWQREIVLSMLWRIFNVKNHTDILVHWMLKTITIISIKFKYGKIVFFGPVSYLYFGFTPPDFQKLIIVLKVSIFWHFSPIIGCRRSNIRLTNQTLLRQRQPNVVPPIACYWPKCRTIESYRIIFNSPKSIGLKQESG